MRKQIIMIILLAGTLIGFIEHTAIAGQKRSEIISSSIEYISKYESNGLFIQVPKGWVFMTPSEVREEKQMA